ncbi:MAG: TerC family protein [Clostridia bacterium]|nr:TerC family protein [Clostridia bacterium]
MPFKKAAMWVGIWVTLAMLFNLGIYYYQGADKALQFTAGYLIELSLSVDNLFVFLMVFCMFNIPAENQKRVLTYGIIGAIILRFIFVILGVTLVEKFHWILYIFGGILILSAYKFVFGKEQTICMENNWLVKAFKRIMPVTKEFHGEKFFVRIKGVLHATPLFLVLLLIESTDVVFAVDSIPAIFAVTRDPFIVYTSNVFAILGLRSMYFFLERIQQVFVYVKKGVGVLLFVTGVKLLLVAYGIKVPTEIALALIVGILGTSIIASIFAARRDKDKKICEPEVLHCNLEPKK